MKNFVTVETNENGDFLILDKGKEIFTVPAARGIGAAELQAHHYRYAWSAFKKCGFKKAETGSNYRAWKARPMWGVEAVLVKHPQSDWSIVVTVDGEVFPAENFKTREAAAKFVLKFGNDGVITKNILNPDAGPIVINRSERGGCTDPGTETYHCM